MYLFKLVSASLIVGIGSVVFFAANACSQEPATQSPADIAAAQAKREAALAELLTGATLRGFFTVTGSANQEGPPRLRGERYDLVEVLKLEGNKWLFRARIRYADHDVTLPLTLPVEWAGDTPVVVVDNIGFPGLGTYSARVLFHNDHYAGHWHGGGRGGHLFGTIERTEPPEENSKSPKDRTNDSPAKP